MDLIVEAVTLEFREPVTTAFGTLSRRELLRVELRTDAGEHGVGEAAPLEAYDGVSLDDTRAALERLREPLRRCDDTDRAATLAAAQSACPLPQALAAVDIALWDLEGRRTERPVAALLSDDPAPAIAVNATIVATDRATAASRGAEAARAGYSCVKLKVGVGDDAGRVAAVRAALGPEVALRLDANGAWSVDEAEDALRVLAPAGIELCEEPVHGVGALRELRGRLDGLVPIAMDESAREPGAVGSGATDLVCLKIAGCGGISGTLAAAAQARAVGAEVYLASSFDGPVGVAAALHAAAALGPMRACGLGTLELMAGDAAGLAARAGLVAVPIGPGLGVN